MSKPYMPDYAPGEILVCFYDKPDINKHGAKLMGQLMGFELKNEDYEFGDSYIFLTPLGKEEFACKKFKQLRINKRPIVDWASQRDMKLERRWNDLEQLVGMAEKLRDDCNARSKPDYNRQLDKIIAYAHNIKGGARIKK